MPNDIWHCTDLRWSRGSWVNAGRDTQRQTCLVTASWHFCDVDLFLWSVLRMLLFSHTHISHRLSCLSPQTHVQDFIKHQKHRPTGRARTFSVINEFADISDQCFSSRASDSRMSLQRLEGFAAFCWYLALLLHTHRFFHDMCQFGVLVSHH